ncbi:MAG: ABC transporter permease [Bacteroidales bacterium]|nr:ABC transporter permease [Bacteroidales bacterium]
MNRLRASVKKEFLLLIHDRVGLMFMFMMPLLLVFVITIVQDNAFRKINEGHISMFIVNHDTGSQSIKLIQLVEASGMFKIEIKNDLDQSEIKQYLLENRKQAAVYIPDDFSALLNEKSNYAAGLMLADFGLMEASGIVPEKEVSEILLFHDPVLQEAYCQNINNLLVTSVQILENTLMLDVIYSQFGIDNESGQLKEKLGSPCVSITQTPASKADIKPNTTQHNVPAWTIFAMFFIVVSLGNNIVKERLNGSFVRLKTMPVNFMLIWGSKTIVYVGVTILQVLVVFSMGIFVFPLIELPELILPNNLAVLIFVVLIIALSAVSYALMIGTLAETQEQANGIGAVSIIIFAVLGGIFVPVFAMPDFLKFISYFSPLYWCLEGFYFLFLKGGNLLDLLNVLWPLFVFIIVCQSITYVKLKIEKII